MDRLPISLCVVTHNSADKLKQMIEKHKSFVSEIMIAVQDSDDNTYEIAKETGAVVFKRTKKGAGDPDRNWLFSLTSMPWVLYLDDDEYLSEDTIKALPELVNDNIDIYWLKTKNLVDKVDIYAILGDDYHPRLFKKGYIHYTEETTVDHSYPTRKEPSNVAFLDHHIVHERSFDKIKKSNRQRNKFATEQQVKMQEGFISQVERFMDSRK